jgi:cytochrome d ubiquinol oxidase subunit II
MTALQLTWFLLVGFFVVGYTVLAGFDLGLSMLALRARSVRERKAILAGLGPFWDGNEVWLVGAGALLFAVFPPVYAALFSGFYILFMPALFGLILRAVSIEFARGAEGAELTGWSIAMGAGSVLSVFLFGVIVGNVLRGIPLNGEGVFTGSQVSLFNPFALLVGGLNLAMIVTHGALYLAWKAEGRIARKARRTAQAAWALYLALAIAVMVMAAVGSPHLLRNLRAVPVLWLVPLLSISAVLFTGILSVFRQVKFAFLTSGLAIVMLLGTAVIGLFPLLVPSLENPDAWSLTITNSSSSPLSLTVMLVITLIGMPFVILYTAWVYRVFGGKIKEEEGY